MISATNPMGRTFPATSVYTPLSREAYRTQNDVTVYVATDGGYRAGLAVASWADLERLTEQDIRVLLQM